MRVLALSPHTDDAEMGAGGYLSKLVRQGADIRIVAFSWCENELLQSEYVEASHKLGITDIILLDFPRRRFSDSRQQILDYLWDLAQHEHFDLVLCPASFDTHQDHQVIRDEVFRAFKHTTIFGYEMPWNSRTFSANAYIVIDECDVQSKIDALACYKTQLGRAKPYFTSEFIRSMLISRGACVLKKYAEAYEVIRYIG